MKLESLKKLYVHELKDLYSAERQLVEALPILAEAANDEELIKALNHHLDETRTHITRLETIFSDLDFSPTGHKCKGMEGLIAEAKDILKSDIDSDVTDAAIIASCQRCEHYEISAYGTARAFADKLGDYKSADLLQKTLDEEGKADKTLSTLAERSINFEAMSLGQ